MKEVVIRLSNKTIYSIISIIIVISIVGISYAIGSGNFNIHGHDTGELQLPAETDPQVSAVTNGLWCRGTGSAVTCDQSAPSSLSSLPWTSITSRPAGLDDGDQIRQLGLSVYSFNIACGNSDKLTVNTNCNTAMCLVSSTPLVYGFPICGTTTCSSTTGSSSCPNIFRGYLTTTGTQTS